MNRQIIRLFLLVVVLFGTVVGFTSYWAVFDSESLAENEANRRPLLEEQKIRRGLIYAKDGTVLARNISHGQGSEKVYSRRYPERSLFGHPVGYNFVDKGSVEIEKSHNGDLNGEKGELDSIIDQLEGKAPEGNDLWLTLNPSAQRVAMQGLGGRRGAVVALDPRNGGVSVLASVPPYDPNQIPGSFKRLVRDPASPLLDRATQAGYPPGSTFKVVAAAAALDSGKFSPTSIVNGDSPAMISGVPLSNFGGASYGSITLTDALTNSVNTAWARVGDAIGKDVLFRYMKRFGFNKKPPIDLPSKELTVSGVFAGKKVLDESNPVDVGRIAIGQERLRVTPLEMAMVVAAIANRGELMSPHLMDRVVDSDGRTVKKAKQEALGRVVSTETASQLTEMMGKVVQEGTGTAAALEGIKVAGKTGTAEVARGSANQAWFIAFAPIDNPRVAIAVTVERTSGEGGTVAAPIAKEVIQALL